MSGYSEDVVANQDALAGGVMYIQKPFDPNELAAKVREVLALHCPRPATDPQK
jgi:DNA-binding response OmpR family regulator